MGGIVVSYRFGFDVGTNSIGWAVLELATDGQPDNLVDLGVRLFSDGRDPKSSNSLNDARRLARGARRRRDRFLRRQKAFLASLVDGGLMPTDPAARKELEGLDPYQLRASGLDSPLSSHELGRALFHLNQRRGFQSNRKTNPGEDEESGKIRSAATRLEEAMKSAGDRTIGEFLARRHAKREGVRARLRGEGAKAEYAFYPTRALIVAEFDQLWASQSRFLAGLTNQLRDRLRSILATQRPLKPQVVGRCTLVHDDERAAWAAPHAQRFRILKELANLEVGVVGHPRRRISVTERDMVLEKLLRSKEVSFDTIRSTLGLDADHRFNLEDDRRTGLKGDETGTRLANKSAFGKAWHALSLAQQEDVVHRLLTEEDEDELLDWLGDKFDLSDEAASKISKTVLPASHCRFGMTVLSRIVPIMQAEAEEASDPATGECYAAPLREPEAIRRAGYHHSDLDQDRTGLPLLPYYGVSLSQHVQISPDGGKPDQVNDKRFGRLPNPTVHIGLNQIRLLINGLIKKYGRPDEIVVELARELKMSRKEREAALKEQADNKKRNDRYRAELAALHLEDNGENRLRLRLWEELSRDPLRRCCPYSGQTISMEMLFSGEVEIEHILPFRRTLDNGGANKTVSLREWNRLKGDRSPWEAFHTLAEWPDILARAQSLPSNKKWRFEPDAMDRFENVERDFLDRQLTDTQYLARLTRQYLLGLYHKDEGMPVWVIPGRLTAMLRGKWGLDGLLSDHNRKNRDDHRHHAIDAFVVACTDRGMLNRVANAADEKRERLIAAMPDPWPGFREQLRTRLQGLIVSHRPDHGKEGALFEDTAYGLIADPAKEDGCNLVFRKPVAGLSEGEVERIRDPSLRARVLGYLSEARSAGVAHKIAIARFADETGIRRVRLLKAKTGAIPIHDRAGKAYKALLPGENHRIEIYQKADGSWAGEAVTIFDANQRDYVPRWRSQESDARPVMIVHKGDLLETEVDGKRTIVRVVRLQISAKRLLVVSHSEGGDFSARDKDKDDSFGWNGWRLLSFSRMQSTATRRVVINVLGQVHPAPSPTWTP